MNFSYCGAGSDVNGWLPTAQDLNNFDSLKRCSDLVTAGHTNPCLSFVVLCFVWVFFSPPLFSFFVSSPHPRVKCLQFLPKRSQIPTRALMHLANIFSLVGWTMRTARLLRRKWTGSALIYLANARGSLGNPSLPPPIVIALCKYYSYLLIFSTVLIQIPSELCGFNKR